jgi:hypothetical protein
MPPQQSDRLLDLFDEGHDFSAHGFSPEDVGMWRRYRRCATLATRPFTPIAAALIPAGADVFSTIRW